MNRNIVVIWILTALIITEAEGFAGEKKQSFSVRKGGTLDVRIDGGDISVRGWEKDEVAVRVQSVSDDQLQNVQLSDGGGKVVVEFRWEGRAMKDMEFEIQVPSSFNIELRTAGGKVAIEGPLTGTLRGQTGGGGITLGNLGGDIQMSTAGGPIKAGEIAGDLNVRTAGGDIKLRSVSGTAEVSTAGGSITVESASKGLRASTAGGDIRLGKITGDVDAQTAGGTISVSSCQGKVSLSTAGGSIEVGTAQGMIHAGTAAGNISLKEVQGSVSARAAAGNISLTLDPAIGESSTLATSAGNIDLRLPASAKASITAQVRGPHIGWGKDENSMIRSDFPVKQSEKGHALIELNGGGHKISLESMIGRIDIKKIK